MPESMPTLTDWLRQKNACAEARLWAQAYETLPEAWNSCANPEWMLWALGKGGTAATDPRYRLLACRFVRETPIGDGRTVWDLLTDPRSRAAVEVAERHARGEATDAELSAARDASWDAALAAAWDAAKASASDAAWAAARDAAWDAQCSIIRVVFTVEDII